VSGFIDLHSHFLPGVDDGVSTVEDALECLRGAGQAGFQAVVLTRHLMSGVYEVPADEAKRRRVELAEAARKAGLTIGLFDGAEHYMDDFFLDLIEKGPETLAGGKAVLVEMPLLSTPPFVGDVAFRLRVKGLVPILAHVERYREVAKDPRIARDLSEMGYLLQVNLGSLAGFYGRRVARAARWALEEDLVFCAAGDGHGPDMLASAYRDGIKELRKYGEDTVNRLLSENPRKAMDKDGF